MNSVSRRIRRFRTERVDVTRFEETEGSAVRKTSYLHVSFRDCDATTNQED